MRGDDAWIAISCRADGEWAALVEVMDRPSWALDPTLATAAGRAAAEDTIEEQPPYRFSRSDVRIRTAPAAFGQHNAYVYGELLGLSEAEQAALREAGHITEEYAAEVLGG